MSLDLGMIKEVAQDGLLAYTLPPQTREKLSQIERLMNILCRSMARKWPNLVYADMLSGPGVLVDKLTREERRGSALIAAQHPEFTRLFINDASDEATSAVRARLGQQPEGRILISTDDCNAAVDAARDFLFPPGSLRNTLGLAVIDPSAYQMRFESIERLTSGGVRLDLMIVFMTSFMRRFLVDLSFFEPMVGILGEDEVYDLIHRRNSGERVSSADLLRRFERRLASIGYEHVAFSAAQNSIGSPVYHIVYASRHRLGREFYQKASAKRATGQIEMQLSLLPN